MNGAGLGEDRQRRGIRAGRLAVCGRADLSPGCPS